MDVFSINYMIEKQIAPILDVDMELYHRKINSLWKESHMEQKRLGCSRRYY